MDKRPSTKVGSGGIYTNLDNKLTDAEWFALERQERNLDTWNNDPRMNDRNMFRGFVPMGGRVMIDKEQEMVSISDIRKMRNQNKPPIPVFYAETPAGDIPVFPPSIMKAFELGYLCENCHNWQKSEVTLKCETLNGFKCGFERRM